MTYPQIKQAIKHMLIMSILAVFFGCVVGGFVGFSKPKIENPIPEKKQIELGKERLAQKNRYCHKDDLSTWNRACAEGPYSGRSY